MYCCQYLGSGAMSNIISLKEKEVNSITKNFSADTGLTYSPRALKTIDDCVEQYNKADEVSHIAQQVIKDRMQGDALLKAKKLICGDEWNLDMPQIGRSLRSKWSDFLSVIGLLTIGGTRDGMPKTNVKYLLDFAGYKERGGEIETASHYREVKKVASSKSDEKEIDALYHESGGAELKTAREVKEAVQEKKISVYQLFTEEVGEEPRADLSSMMAGVKIQEAMPNPTESEWKDFYRTVANCIHPDKGGREEHATILTQLNTMYQIMFKHNKQVAINKAWWADYKIWKEDNGYTSEFIKEEYNG